MKMVQKLYPCDQDWTEVFYDGELRIVNNIADVPKGREHWIDHLYLLGYDVYEEPETTPTQAPSKKKVTKEITNGTEST
jgi:hypothetical protein